MKYLIVLATAIAASTVGSSAAFSISQSSGITTTTRRTTLSPSRTSPLFASTSGKLEMKEAVLKGINEKKEKVKKALLKRLAIKAFSNFQLFLITHPNPITRLLGSLCYVVDLIVYSQGMDGPKKFLTDRQAILGKNFAGLGRILVTDYEEAVATLTSPQKRGTFLGRVKLDKSKCPANFLLFLDDKEAGGTDLHSKLHLNIWETMAPAAIERATTDSTGAFKNYLKEGKKIVLATNDEASRKEEVFKMTIRYVWHALFGVALPNEEYVQMVYDRYEGQDPKTSFLLGAAMPASFALRSQPEVKLSEKKLANLVMESPYMQSYEPTEKHGNYAKEDWAVMLLGAIGIAGVLGTATLNSNILKYVSSADINIEDESEVTNAVLEAARIRAPVNNINTILPKKKTMMVNGKTVELPKDSILVASIGAASLDEDVFPNPKTFDPKRTNLVESSINFNHHGWDPETVGTRVCPGRVIAMKMASDWLLLLKEE